MKSDAPRHPKMLHFAELLEVKPYSARGLMEMFWIFVGEYAATGALGKISNASIAKAIDWDGNPDDLIDAMVKAGFLEMHNCCPEHALVVHDWADHVPEYIKRRLKNKHLQTYELCPDSVGLFPTNGGNFPTNGRPPNRTEPNPTKPNRGEPNPTEPANGHSQPETDLCDGEEPESDDSDSPSDCGMGDCSSPSPSGEAVLLADSLHRFLGLVTPEQLRSGIGDAVQAAKDAKELREKIAPAILRSQNITASQAKIVARECRSARTPIAMFKSRLKDDFQIDLPVKQRQPRMTRAGPTNPHRS